MPNGGMVEPRITQRPERSGKRVSTLLPNTFILSRGVMCYDEFGTPSGTLLFIGSRGPMTCVYGRYEMAVCRYTVSCHPGLSSSIRCSPWSSIMADPLVSIDDCRNIID